MPDGEASNVIEMASCAENNNSIEGRSTVYICSSVSYQLPVARDSEMFNLLE